MISYGTQLVRTYARRTQTICFAQLVGFVTQLAWLQGQPAMLPLPVAKLLSSRQSITQSISIRRHTTS